MRKFSEFLKDRKLDRDRLWGPTFFYTRKSKSEAEPRPDRHVAHNVKSVTELAGAFERNERALKK